MIHGETCFRCDHKLRQCAVNYYIFAYDAKYINQHYFYTIHMSLVFLLRVFWIFLNPEDTDVVCSLGEKMTKKTQDDTEKVKEIQRVDEFRS